jgi:hypothetical protein
MNTEKRSCGPGLLQRPVKPALGRNPLPVVRLDDHEVSAPPRWVGRSHGPAAPRTHGLPDRHIDRPAATPGTGLPARTPTQHGMSMLRWKAFCSESHPAMIGLTDRTSTTVPFGPERWTASIRPNNSCRRGG